MSRSQTTNMVLAAVAALAINVAAVAAQAGSSDMTHGDGAMADQRAKMDGAMQHGDGMMPVQGEERMAPMESKDRMTPAQSKDQMMPAQPQERMRDLGRE